MAHTGEVRNLVYDTLYGRARGGLMNAVHRMDDAVWQRRGGPRRVLFEAASPLSLVVFGPIYERLRRDERVEVWFTTADPFWDAEKTFGAAGIRDRVIGSARAQWMKFDAYINADFTNMTWLRRRTRRIHLFHGVAGKYSLDAPVKLAPLIATFDRLLFPNADRIRKWIDAGLIRKGSAQGALVGYPKVDCLVDGSLERAAIEASLRIDCTRPTVLYAPTWSPASSLNAMGEGIVRAVAAMHVNLIVKLHDRSLDLAPRGSGGIDWRTRLGRVCDECGAHLAQGPDASPYLYVADALITDHSSAGFEFMLLDRPMVVVYSPELIEKASVNPEKAALLQSAGSVVSRADEVAAAVTWSLQHPSERSGRRRSIAAELFYGPGGATERAARCIYDALSLPFPGRADDSVEPAPAEIPARKRGSLKCVS